MAKGPRAVIPCLTYRNAHAAIEFLGEAFGFQPKMVMEGEKNSVAHAELVLGDALIMLGSTKDTDYGRLIKPPLDAGIATQSLYLVVDDVDAHHARAVRGGAEIILPPTTQDYGGRDYTCRDIEGHVWTFGTYDPWAA